MNVRILQLKNNIMILLVEDDENIRQPLAELLKFEGYPVEFAENGRVALDHLKSGLRPDIILLDMMMPVMGGEAFLKEYLLESDLRSIPVVVLSANAQNHSTHGAIAHLRKPIDIGELLKLLSDKIPR